MGGGFSQTSVSPCRCTSARAFPGFASSVQDSRRVCVQDGVVRHRFVRRHADDAVLAVGALRRASVKLQHALRCADYDAVPAFPICPGGRRKPIHGGSGRAVHGADGLPGRSGSPCQRLVGWSARSGTGGRRRRHSAIRRPRLHRIRIDRRRQRPRRVDRRRIDLHPARRQRLAHERRAAQVVDLLDLPAAGKPVRNLADLPLGIAEHEQVGLGVEQDRATHLLRPVVEVRDAAQRRLDAADHHRDVLVRLADALGIHDYAAIRSRAACAVRGVGVVRADAAIRGVAVHHRVHVAAGDAEEQVRLAELHEVAGRVPIGLGNDAHAEALRL